MRCKDEVAMAIPVTTVIRRMTLGHHVGVRLSRVAKAFNSDVM